MGYVYLFNVGKATSEIANQETVFQNVVPIPISEQRHVNVHQDIIGSTINVRNVHQG